MAHELLVQCNIIKTTTTTTTHLLRAKGKLCQPEVITGKPIAVGGSLGRTEATGRGLSFTVREAAKRLKIDMKTATVAVQGFGNAGQFSAQLVGQMGAKVIAASDTKGGVYNNKNGIDVDALRRHKEKTGSVIGFPDAKSISNEELLETECTILIWRLTKTRSPARTQRTSKQKS